MAPEHHIIPDMIQTKIQMEGIHVNTQVHIYIIPTYPSHRFGI